MRYVKLLLPFVLVYFACGNSLRFLARISHRPFHAYNEQLEGARILDARRGLLRGRYPQGRDILFAGTSRMMADVSPSVFAERLKHDLGAHREFRAYNLGNVANNLPAFTQALSADLEPALLVLELHPNMFTAPAPGTGAEPGFFDSYREQETLAELAAAGTLKRMAHTISPARLGTHTIVSIRMMLQSRPPDPGPVYYAHLNQYGYGQVLQPDGQVYYRRFLAGRADGEQLRQWCSEFPTYSAMLPAAGRHEPSYAAFRNLLRRLAPDHRIIVVRLPVSERIYNLENATMSRMYARAAALMHRYGVPYVDMNPGDYFQADESHTDWYDTSRLSRDFAGLAAPFVSSGPLAQRFLIHVQTPEE